MKRIMSIIKRGITSKEFLPIVIFLILISIFPSYESIILRTEQKVSISETSETVRLQEGDQIQQSIYIRPNSKLKYFNIWFSTQASVNNSGKIRVILKQGEFEKSAELDTSTLVGNEYCRIDINTKKFKPGFVDVLLQIEDLNEGAVVNIRLTENAKYGLPPAIINNEKKGGTLSVDYVLTMRDRQFFIDCILIILAVFTILVAALIMCFNETPFTGYFLMFTEAALVLEVLSLLFPSWSYEGIAWAEGVTVFYDDAVHKSAEKCLTRLEGNMYLSAFNSFVTVLAVKVLGLRRNLFVFLQYVGLLFRAMCLAPFCSHYFKKLFNRPVRFAVAFVGICFIYPYFHFIGSAYAGVFFLILLLLFDYEEINNVIYLLALGIASLICMSKFYYVIFAPVSAIFLLLCWKNCNKKKRAAVSVIGLAGLCEGIFSILIKKIGVRYSAYFGLLCAIILVGVLIWCKKNKTKKIRPAVLFLGVIITIMFSLLIKKGVNAGNHLGTLQTVSLHTLIEKTVYYVIQFFNTAIWHGLNVQNQLYVNMIGISLFLAILSFSCIQIVKKGRYSLCGKYILVMLCLCGANCVLELLATTDFHAPIRWDQVRILSGEHYIFGYVSMLVILGIIVYMAMDFINSSGQMIPGMEKRITVMLFVMVLYTVNQHPKAKGLDYTISGKYMIGDWKTYEKMSDDEEFLIRIDPDGWFYGKNAARLRVNLPGRKDTIVPEEYQEFDNIQDKETLVLYAKKSSLTNQVEDKYYYMTLYDKEDRKIACFKQLNNDVRKQYIAFDLRYIISDIGRLRFTYEDGTPAEIEGNIDIGYKANAGN